MSFGLFISLSLISLLFVFGFIFILLPLKIKLRYFYQGENSYFRLEIKLWPGIRVYRRLFFRNKFKSEGKKKYPDSPLGNIYQFIVYYRPLLLKLFPVMLYFIKKLKLQQLYWQTKIGLSDTAFTAMAIGWIWSIKGLFLAIIYRYLGLPATKPVVVVTPDFSKPAFIFLINSVFTVRAGYFLVAGVKIMITFLFYFLTRFLRHLGQNHPYRASTGQS
ncbi:MAG TPA: hypothetical protein DCK87_09140 [Desulfotomaculum sp.]|nr:hypothetical protein [Desulfotomaculum sp.]